jgi:large subunit ribosomal protein L3
VEIRVDEPNQYKLGQEIKIADVLSQGGLADVTGVSKGKGFQGVMKRHGFAGLGAAHGAHKKHRAPGSIGACATPARVFKGKKMPGRMGNDQVTTLNLQIVGIDTERDLLLLRGAVPGANGSLILVREAVKA